MSSRLYIVLILPVFLFACRSHYIKQEQKFEHYSLKDKTVSVQINDTITRFKKKVDAETARVIAYSSEEITKDGSETTLGNFVCDALKYAAEKEFKNDTVDIIIVNRGGLRANLPKGEIRVQNIFELMPFENEMVQVKIHGAALFSFLALLPDKKHPFSGLTVKIKNKEIVSAYIGKMEIDSAKVYTLITSDYLANGGDNFTFLQNRISLKNFNIKIRDAIISYCESKSSINKPIEPYKDGRLEISE